MPHAGYPSMHAGHRVPVLRHSDNGLGVRALAPGCADRGLVCTALQMIVITVLERAAVRDGYDAQVTDASRLRRTVVDRTMWHAPPYASFS